MDVIWAKMKKWQNRLWMKLLMSLNNLWQCCQNRSIKLKKLRKKLQSLNQTTVSYSSQKLKFRKNHQTLRNSMNWLALTLTTKVRMKLYQMHLIQSIITLIIENTYHKSFLKKLFQFWKRGEINKKKNNSRETSKIQCTLWQWRRY